ncbi:aspartate aminotransferase family protein [Carnobacterium mobile]|uniref:aspartate aminotransferase family protein n=1 Tax=Carnobacterium mobile TaxID=2750 RepID=UPI0006902039|nr:aminotransferase class III-fold pyridoxal phosphate-dependent enzyme [Carnobacterium mobile]
MYDYNDADKYFVGSVSSGWNKMENINPLIVKKAEKCFLLDDKNDIYTDYCMGWGSLFLGHNPNYLSRVFEEAKDIGFGFQYENKYHLKLAKQIVKNVPSAEKVRFTNTGTESTMQAIRMARSITSKEKIIKFEGHFHGVNDYLNFSNDVSNIGKRLSNGTIESLPGSSGIPLEMSKYVISLAYNDIESFEKIISEEEIAGVILEPICLASAIMFPKNDFLKKLRKLCTESNIILIFDEVMSGFRNNIGGAQKDFAVTPDITIISKILGGGFPISAIVGKKEYMDILDPVGDCIVSGTNNGRILSVIGAYHTVKFLQENPNVYELNQKNMDYFIKNVNEILNRKKVEGIARGYGGRVSIHFGTTELQDNYESVIKTWDKEKHMRVYDEAFKNKLYGFLLPLSRCPEPICITPIHTKEILDETLNIFEKIVMV